MHRLTALVLLVSASAIRAEVADDAAWAIDVAYTAETWAVGDHATTSYLDNLDVSATLDAEQMFGLRGVQLFAYGLYNNGHALEGAETIQGVSNIETVRAWRLYEAWAQWQFAPSASVLAGLYDLNSEFDAIDAASLFINPSHGIGPDFAQSGENGPSIFPNTSAAVRVQFGTDRWQARVAVLDAVSGDPARPEHTTVRWNSDEGLLYAAELNYTVAGGARTAVGYWRYSEQFATLVDERNAVNDGMYLFVESEPLGLPNERGELRAFTRTGWANEDINAVERYHGAGVVWNGFVRGRDDQLGVSLAHASMSSAWRDAARSEGIATRNSETIVELTARVALADFVTVQPDIQYVRHPSANGGNSLWAFGLRLEAAFSSRR